jgi:hypothetical protein
MPGTFTFDAANNRVTVTGGTSSSPARFSDFVTADRAGSRTLRAAIAPALNITLTTQIKPCEKLALLISFVLAGTNAGAGDTLDITGTDAWGNAQAESISVAAGNGTYVSTKRFRTITDIDCTGFADGVGTVTVTQPQWGVIWGQGSSQYLLDCYIYVGNGSTATFFKTILEQISWSTGWQSGGGNTLRVYGNATFQSGELVTEATKRTSQGSQFNNKEASNYTHLFVNSGGTIYLYATAIQGLAECRIYDVTRIWNCLFSYVTYPYIENVATNIYNLTTEEADRAIRIESTTNPVIDTLVSFGNYIGLYLGGPGGFTARNVKAIANSYGFRFWTLTQDVILIDCIMDSWTRNDQSPGSSTKDIYRKYSFNLHLVDKNGTNVSGATVTLKDKNANTVFSVSTGADGKIAEQTPTRIKYDHAASWAEVDYSPHTLTITKTGYADYQDIITLDRKMDLEIGLGDAVATGGGVSPTNLGLVPLGIKQVAV